MRLKFISLLTLMACRSDLGVKEFNALPTIQIISHGDGSQLEEGVLTTIISQSSDNNHDATSLITNWYADDEELCTEQPVAADGLSSCESLIPYGTTVIRAAVRDPDNGGGEDEISIIVIENLPPSAEIQTPLDNETYSQNGFIPFEAIISDTEDSPETLEYTLQSDIDGALDNSTVPDSSGFFEMGLSLSPGAHRISLTVTDSGGKTATDSVGLFVSELNTPPSCAILTPTDGSEQYGDPIQFSGTVSDIDQNDTDLSTIWTSSRDGIINTENPNSSGELNFEAALSTGVHTITLEATDNEGATCIDEIDLTYSAGPNIVISNPVNDLRVNIGETMTFEAEVSNTLGPAENLTVTWESSIEGLLLSSQTDSNGFSSATGSLSLNGQHTLTASVTDASSLTGVTQTIITVNASPTAPTLSMSPVPASTIDDIIVTASGSIDYDNDPITYTYEWARNGTPSNVSTSPILSSTATNKGDTWTVTVTPEDPYSVGQSSSQSIEIDNANPSILSIAMVPNSPNNRDTVQCTATATDPDPTDLNSLSTVYQWRNLTSNTLLSNANSLSLSPSSAEVGDVIECTATVTDIDGGIGTTNATVIISNTNPSIGSVNISPATPGVNDSASCTASGIDLDGDSIAMSYEWSSGTNALGSGNTLDLSTTSLQRGDTLTCTATAADGNGGQAIDSTTATIGNSAPEITGVEILVNGTPSGTALAGDTLSCNALGYTDADGDSGQFIYQWKVNGAPTASSASINSGFVRTDVVSCELTPFDGQSFGVSQTASVTINNSPPVISSVSLSPSSPNINSTITANIVATDLDGDNITYLYSWLVNGTPVYNGTSLTSAYFTQGDSIALEVTPDDGITTGPNVTSSSLFITNSPPTAATLLITPTNPVAEYDDLVCSVLVPSTDADNDPVSYTMTWLLDGNNYTNSTATEWPGDTILYTDVQVGDTWTCIATPTDGIDDGVTSTATVTITECTDGSIAECAAQSCLELFQNGQSNGDGGYFLNPNGTNVDEYYCDMQNGGWTGINFTQANDLLGGVMVDVIAASTDGIDQIRGPFTRDGNSNHSYHYTFEFLPGFNEFKFQNYEIKANAGSGDTSDINLNSFVMSSWNKAYGGARGDVGFGTAAQSGPVANLSIDHGTSSNCNSCIYTMSNAIHSIGAVETSFRIGWGESGSEKEGWYPWYDGLLLLK